MFAEARLHSGQRSNILVAAHPTRREPVEAGRLEAVQFSGLEQTSIGSSEKELEIVVRPRPSGLRRLRDPRVTSRYRCPWAHCSPSA